jgi:hypothetical protein
VGYLNMDEIMIMTLELEAVPKEAACWINNPRCGQNTKHWSARKEAALGAHLAVTVKRIWL